MRKGPKKDGIGAVGVETRAELGGMAFIGKAAIVSIMTISTSQLRMLSSYNRSSMHGNYYAARLIHTFYLGIDLSDIPFFVRTVATNGILYAKSMHETQLRTS
ncbi:hypothetical protein F5Y17DRAFT_280343 [Xylariaceae sp. FL0594]|nr:hypothetical protein F5Y17DRAFT_280343 [Xylariaceae sp. FL0594]